MFALAVDSSSFLNDCRDKQVNLRARTGPLRPSGIDPSSSELPRNFLSSKLFERKSELNADQLDHWAQWSEAKGADSEVRGQRFHRG